MQIVLESGSKREIRRILTSTNPKLTLPEANRLANHLNEIESPSHVVRLGIVHSYTSDLLDPWFKLEAALHGLEFKTYHAPYGLNLQEAQANSGLVAHKPDLTLMLMRREDIHPDLTKPLSRLNFEQQAQIRQEGLSRVCNLLKLFREQVDGHILTTFLPAIFPPGLGFYDTQSERSESTWWTVFKSQLAQRLKDTMSASFLLDLDDALSKIGREAFFDLRFWYSSQFPFSQYGAREVAHRLAVLAATIKYPKAKVIVLDADNTLWGGIIGEEGLNGISLGPEYPGSAYMDFQRRLLDYQQRGFILALCSKNNPEDVDLVLKEHPHQIIRDENIAARRVNWIPKTENLVSLADELNIGLDSFIFVDDSDHECAAVLHELPQIEVIKTPKRPMDVPTCLDSVARLEILSLTSEDLNKTALYSQERQRKELKNNVDLSGGNLKDYLASLEMKMKIRFNDQTQVSRLSQLTQKTNQFNLTTRRYTEQQILKFISSSKWLVAHFSLEDIFGDAGIVGLTLMRYRSARQVELDTFLMSCRVIGREAESAFMQALLRYLVSQGVNQVYAEYLATQKNALVKEFLSTQGFDKHTNGHFVRDLASLPPEPQSAYPIIVQTAIK